MIGIRLASFTVTGVFLGVGSITAQRTVVNPPANASLEGNSRITFPFGGRSAIHYQQICALSVVTGSVGSIRQVAFRRDNDTAVGSGDYSAWSVDLDLTVSTSPRTPLSMSLTFARNAGTDVKLVHSGTINWPAQKKSPPGPTPFAYVIPFSTPFVYTRQGELLLDIVHKSSTNTNTMCFMDADSSGGGSSANQIGVGCPTGRNTSLPSSNWGPGAYSRIVLYNTTANCPAIFSIGVSGSTWGPFRLPLDLGPIGAPGCKIYNDNVVWVIGKTDMSSSPRWDLRFEMPNDPNLGGAKLFTQFYVLNDSAAGNLIKLSVSDGHEITIATVQPGVPPQSEAHSSSLTAPDAGLVQQGYGMIVEFGY